MKALITGAGGFVGRHLAAYLKGCGDEVVLGDLRAVPAVSGTDEIQALDVTDMEACTRVIGAVAPAVIYHLAGIAFVPEAEANFLQTLAVNVAGTSNVLRACHLLQSGTTVVVVSSAEVYGTVPAEELPISEQTPLRPQNNYSLSKLMAELVAERYGRQGYVRPVVVRPFNHIGPGQDPRFVVSSFACQLAKIAGGAAEPVIKVGNLDVQRDFLDVRDVVRAYRLAALQGRGPYNLCSGQPVAIRRILELLIELSQTVVKIETDPARRRSADVPLVVGTYARAEEELGWLPEYELPDTLRTVYQYWRQR